MAKDSFVTLLCLAFLLLVRGVNPNSSEDLKAGLEKLGDDKCNSLFDAFTKYGSVFCKCKNGVNGQNGNNGRDGEMGLPGPPGSRGMEGEVGLPGKQGPAGVGPGSTLQLGESYAICDTYTAGTIRYNRTFRVLQFCNGKEWLTTALETKGRLKQRPGRSCRDILESGHSHGSDLYWIDPNGGLTDDSFQAFCDMTTDNGGWTLVSTKRSRTSRIISAVYSEKAASTLHTSTSSHIHPGMVDWKEVMFRFSDNNNIRVIYNRAGGSPGQGKVDFEKFLMGKSIDSTDSGVRVGGFYKFSPSVNMGQRTPSLSFYSIRHLVFKSSSGIVTEKFGNSDKWLNLWNSKDGTNYYYADNSDCVGQKCVAGYCALDTPIWLMVR